MAYGHAERDLVLIRQLEAGTGQLPGSPNQPDPACSAAWAGRATGGTADEGGGPIAIQRLR